MYTIELLKFRLTHPGEVIGDQITLHVFAQLDSNGTRCSTHAPAFAKTVKHE